MVGYLGYGGEYMGTFETHGRLHQPFPFSHIFTASIISGKAESLALLVYTPYSAIAITYENFYIFARYGGNLDSVPTFGCFCMLVASFSWPIWLEELIFRHFAFGGHYK